MTIDGPAAFLVVMFVILGISVVTTPSRRRHQIQMEEIKSRSGAQFEELNAEYTRLAQETRETQSSMQADIGAIRTSVESIEKMMRDVG
ncbi:MAG: hypothetical protein WC971_07010 [Coriobacteriia bacterium]